MSGVEDKCKRPSVVVQSLLAIGLALFGGGTWAEAGPNIVLVSIDTLRADHCSLYGYGRPTTPNMERLAREGATFNQAYAPMGQTGPSHATLFTGLYPITHGVIKNGRVLPKERTTLAEHLAAHGYETVAFVSAFPLDRRFGLDQGFETYDDRFQFGEETVKLSTWEGETLAAPFDRRGDYTLAKANAWLKSRSREAKPFFLFVHFFDPHSPHRPTREAVMRILGDDRPRQDLPILLLRYDGEVAFADELVGGLMGTVEELGLREDTIFVVTADHGEGLMQRGYNLHGMQVYEEEVRVPLVFRWPGHIKTGQRIHEPVAIADVAPTLLALAGYAMKDGSVQGLNLAPALLEGEAPSLDRPIYLMRPDYREGMMAAGWSGRMPNGSPAPRFYIKGPKYGVRQDSWKYIIGPEEKSVELYNLKTDPHERSNVRKQHPAIVATLHKNLVAWMEANAAEASAEELLDEETRRALDALGYTN